jgi:hypothetical protein
MPPPKLRDYVLDATHPDNRGKTRFFEALGYRRDAWHVLEADIRSQHLTQNARETASSRYGRIFLIDAVLSGTAGTGKIRTVWIIPSEASVPSL